MTSPSPTNLPSAARRIVSLLPAATEIVAVLGLEDALVGISHECDHPPSITNRRVLTKTRLDASAPSGSIDREVRELVGQGLSLYEIDEEALRELQPDLILTQDQCRVCAVSLSEVEAALATRLGVEARLLSLAPACLEDILGDVERVAVAAGVPEAGRVWMAAARERIEDLRRLVARAHRRPRVVCLEWLDPLIAGGHWVPELIELGGGTDPLGRAGEAGPHLTWSQLVEVAPEVLLLQPCGFRLEQTLREVPAVAARPEWRQLPAVQNGRVYAVDGNAYLNRPGPRILESAELLAGLIQPGFAAHRIPPGSWVRIDDGRS